MRKEKRFCIQYNKSNPWPFLPRDKHIQILINQGRVSTVYINLKKCREVGHAAKNVSIQDVVNYS